MLQRGNTSGSDVFTKDKCPHGGTIYVVAGNAGKREFPKGMGKKEKRKHHGKRKGKGRDNPSWDHPAHAVSVFEPGSVVLDMTHNSATLRMVNMHGIVRDRYSVNSKL